MHADTKGCTFDEQSQYADLAAEVFSLLADPTRVRIILALRRGELTVNDLAQRVGKSPTSVSQHLAKLRWGKVVQARQEGNRAYYSLIDEHARQLVTEAVLQAQHVVGGMPEHHRQDLDPAHERPAPADRLAPADRTDRADGTDRA